MKMHVFAMRHNLFVLVFEVTILFEKSLLVEGILVVDVLIASDLKEVGLFTTMTVVETLLTIVIEVFDPFTVIFILIMVLYVRKMVFLVMLVS